jgi:3-oxoacyl-[acyl-carrier protein] reductase
MAHLLDGKRALVTGAGRGVGVEIAKHLAAEGAQVAVHYRGSHEGAEETAATIRAMGGTAILMQADLTDAAQVERLVSETLLSLGGLEILVNNAAGFGPLHTVIDAPWEEIDAEWNAVTKPVYLLTRALLPHCIAQKEGRIVNLAATLLQRPQPAYSAHAMAKAAVLALTRTLAREVGQHGITVNAVSPGLTLTEFSLSLPESLKTAVTNRTPLRRLATSEDVAKAVVFFCSPLADFITGANIAPDGGLAVL